MNREQRRAHGIKLAHQYARSYECPDCLADTRLIEQAPGVYVLQVAHDDTCPTYRKKRKQP